MSGVELDVQARAIEGGCVGAVGLVPAEHVEDEEVTTPKPEAPPVIN